MKKQTRILRIILFLTFLLNFILAPLTISNTTDCFSSRISRSRSLDSPKLPLSIFPYSFKANKPSSKHFHYFRDVSYSRDISSQLRGLIPFNDYVPLRPIIIRSDEDWQLYNFPGIGSFDDPFIIDGYNITVPFNSSNNLSDAIFITNTTKHFVIKNCYINGKINMLSVPSVTLSNNSILSNMWVEIKDSSNINVIGNIILSTINIVHSSNIKIINNTVGFYIDTDWDYGFHGFYIEFSNNICIKNNRGININNPKFMIGIFFSANILINNNTCGYKAYSLYGSISAKGCKNASITNNLVKYNSIGITGENITVKNNTISDLMETYFGTYGIGVTYAKNVTVEDNKICSATLAGIEVWDAESIVARRNIAWNNTVGIRYSNVTRGKIEENICYDNILDDIAVVNFTKDIIVAQNICNNTIIFPPYKGEYILGWGITIWGFCSNITVIENQCSNNTYGIALLHCNDTITIIGNIISYCFKGGMWLWNENDTLITYNSFINNSYGIVIDAGNITYHGETYYYSCYNNTIHHNNFISNTPLNCSSQAYDAGVNNTWYDASILEGNYWSDLSDTSYPYFIAGPAGAFDPYPLSSPVVYPSLSSSFSFFHSFYFFLSVALLLFIFLSLSFLFFRRLSFRFSRFL